jgi:ATP-dependent DNA helicase DinG
MIDWRPLFPLKIPRPEQERALDQLCQDVVDGKEILVAELGTGVGKSAVAVTLARWLDAYEAPKKEGFNRGAVVLTSQKLLQDQYIRDFSQARDLRSAANFECNRPELGQTCAISSRVRKAFRDVQGDGSQHDSRVKCQGCPYRTAKDAFANGPLGVTNYSYFLSEAVYADELPLRHLLILDEAHNIEDEVRRWSSVSVSSKDAGAVGLGLPPRYSNPTKLISWLLGDYRDSIMERLAAVQAKLSKVIVKGKISEKVIGKLAEENEQLDKRLCQINRIESKGGEILVSVDAERETITYQPLNVDGIANEVLFSRACRVLMLTATVLDEDVFRRSVGLPDGNGFVSIPTPFLPSAFGVHLRPVGKMSRAGIEQSLPSIPKAIRKILADHPNEKGIIHTTNYNITRKIAEVKDRRLLIQGQASDRNDIIKKHMESSEPTVLVSPGMMEGLDLRDDLGRFQVICKVPYPDVSDPVVKRKMESDREWYAWRTIRSLAQSMGRTVRSEQDYTSTYILDECYVDMLDRWGYMFPKHLVDEMQVEEPF